MTAVTAGYGANHLGTRAALTNGFSAAFLCAAGIAAAGGLLGLLTLSRPASQPADPSEGAGRPIRDSPLTSPRGRGRRPVLGPLLPRDGKEIIQMPAVPCSR